MNFTNPFAKDAGGAVARTTLAVYLVDLLPEEYREFGKAVIVVVIGLWSLYQKYQTRQKLVTAIASPTVMTEQQIEKKIAAGQAAPVTTPAAAVPIISASR